MSDKRVLFFIFTSLTSLYAGGTQQVSSELLPILHVSDESSTLEDTDAASEGTVTAKQLQDRPLLRPAEVLETVPGLIVTQHSGDGKANQYFSITGQIFIRHLMICPSTFLLMPMVKDIVI